MIIEARNKPAWNDLPQDVREVWIQQTLAFYPEGSMTVEAAVELAQSEYEQSESESLLPPTEPAELNTD